MQNQLALIRRDLTDAVLRVSANRLWLPPVGTPAATAAYTEDMRNMLNDTLFEAERLVDEVRKQLFALQV